MILIHLLHRGYPLSFSTLYQDLKSRLVNKKLSEVKKAQIVEHYIAKPKHM